VRPVSGSFSQQRAQLLSEKFLRIRLFPDLNHNSASATKIYKVVVEQASRSFHEVSASFWRRYRVLQTGAFPLAIGGSEKLLLDQGLEIRY
jgi:hypothetical protein